MFDLDNLDYYVRPLRDELHLAATRADRRGQFGRAVELLERQGQLSAAIEAALATARAEAARDLVVGDALAVAFGSAKARALITATLRSEAVQALVRAAGVEGETWRERGEHLRGDPRVVAVAVQLGAAPDKAASAALVGPDDDGYYELSSTRRDVRAQVETPEEALAAFQRLAERERERTAPSYPPRPSQVRWAGLDFDLDELNGELRTALAKALPADGAMHRLAPGARVQDALAAWDEDTNGRFEEGTPRAALVPALDALDRAERQLHTAHERLREAQRALGLWGGARA